MSLVNAGNTEELVDASSKTAGGKIVAALGMTHTPGLGNLLDLPPKDQVERILSGFEEAKGILAAARPDVIIALVNDHFDMSSMNNMPTFSVSVAEEHFGPPESSEDWIQLKRAPIAGHREYAMDILRAGISAGFDLTRWGAAEFVHNVLLPIRYLRPERDLPVVPVFTNCLVPPLPSFSRCYAFGEVLSDVIATRPERVAIIASGGISHWPAPPDSGKINEDWDRDFLDRWVRGDRDDLLAYTDEDIYRDAGQGGFEIRTMIAISGLCAGNTGEIWCYQPIPIFAVGCTIGVMSLAG